MSQFHEKQSTARVRPEVDVAREVRAVLPERLNSQQNNSERFSADRPEEIRVVADDAAAASAIRNDMVRQITQELVGVGPGFRANAVIVVKGQADNTPDIDPVTKQPRTQRAAAERTVREGIEESQSESEGRRESRRSENRLKELERLRLRSDGKATEAEGSIRDAQVLDDRGAGQSDRSRPVPKLAGPLTQYRETFRSEQQNLQPLDAAQSSRDGASGKGNANLDSGRVLLSRTIARESQLSTERKPTKSASLALGARSPQVEESFREILLRTEQLYVVSVAVGHEGGNQIQSGDEKALFDSALLSGSEGKIEKEQERNIDRQRARIEIELRRHARQVPPKNVEFERTKGRESESKKDHRPEFVSHGKWRDRFGEMLQMGSAELPRSALQHKRSRKSSRLPFLLLLVFVALVVLARI